jgi:hypothetical protein
MTPMSNSAKLYRQRKQHSDNSDNQHRPSGSRLLLRPQNDFDALRSWFLHVLFWRQDFDTYSVCDSASSVANPTPSLRSMTTPN